MSSTSTYIPSDYALQFVSFIRAAGVEDNNTPEIHYRLADKYFSTHPQVMIESFRGSAKSTLMEWYVLYAAVNGHIPNFGVVNFIAFVGDSAENGVKNFFRNIQAKYDRSDFLKQFIKIKRCTTEEAEIVNVSGHQLNIKGYGMKTNIRGVRYNGMRPEIVILDDVTTNEALTSEPIRKTISENFYKAIIPSLHPKHFRLFVIGTPISQQDLLSKLRNNDQWVTHRFPIAEKFPCSREEFKGNWPDRFDYDAVMLKYKTFENDGELQSFYQEYMLEITDLSTLLVDEGDVKWFDPSAVIKKKDAYNFYISTDFATSTKKSADYSVIGVWAINNNGDWMLVDGQCKRQTMQENIDDVFEYVRKWKPLSVGIESSGQQGGFISIMQDMMVDRNTWFTFAKKPGSKEPGIRPNKDKVHRFVTGVQPMFKQGRIWLPKPEITKAYNPKLFELVEELVSELSKFTLAGGVAALAHDDCGTYDMRVDTPTGYKLLGELRDSDEVISFGPRGSAITKVRDARITGIKPIVNIELESGAILKFSEFHPILAGNKYVLARDLRVGDIVTRNHTWKQQLSMTELNGLESLEDTTNLLQDVQTEVGRTGYISTSTSVRSEEFPTDTTCTTKMGTSRTITSQILSYCSQQNIKLSITSRIKLMGIDLLTMWQRTSKKYKHWLKKEKQESTSEKIREENCLINQSNVLTAETSSHLMQKHVKILSSAVTAVETLGTRHILQNANVESVEQYSNLVLAALSTAALSADLRELKEQLEKTTSMYVACAEIHSQELYKRFAAERNAQELEQTSLSVSTEQIKRIWISAPELTYNFEVDEFHNYQVCDGVVVHNCLDILNQLSEMEIHAPSNDAGEESTVVHKNDIWTGMLDDDNDMDGFGSTVF